MNKYIKNLYNIAPVFIQNAMVTLYNVINNSNRYRGNYKNAHDYFKNWRYKSLQEIQNEQEKRLTSFLRYARNHSAYYRERIPNKEKYIVADLKNISITSKETLIQQYNRIRTIPERAGMVSFTGGTTGASLKVVYKWEDVQERRAFLDLFWEQYGYQRGNRTAWFSGKHIVTNDNSKTLWRKEWLNKIRYYSTFHITRKNIHHYIRDLNKFQPKFMVGFPSSVYEIARLALEENLQYNGHVVCFFPTAESLLQEEVKTIKRFFRCDVRDQYASSEGAPFITECSAGNLHYEMLTGIIEVVDDNLQPSHEGQMLVTSFSTQGTPLIRYQIGDRIRWRNKSEKCSCGMATPMVEKIFGRTNDYVLSPDQGRINLGNISNCTKEVKGILSFQIIQESKSTIEVLIVPGAEFTQDQSNKFLSNLRYVTGPSMDIKIRKVDYIEREKSGKHRIVKNSL